MAEKKPLDYIESLFKDGLFTDFVVECGGHSFKVHKSYLFPHSGYFRTLFASQMKEVAESKVVFKDIDPSVVARVLLYCYNGNQYPQILGQESLPGSCHDVVTKDRFKGTESRSFLRAELALDLIEVADRFDVPKLREDAVAGFKNAFAAVDESGTAPQAMLDRERCLPLVKRMYSNDLPVSLQDSFRSLVLTTLKQNAKRGNRTVEQQKFLEDMANEIEDLREAVIKDYMKPSDASLSQGGHSRKFCGSCRTWVCYE